MLCDVEDSRIRESESVHFWTPSSRETGRISTFPLLLRGHDDVSSSVHWKYYGTRKYYCSIDLFLCWRQTLFLKIIGNESAARKFQIRFVRGQQMLRNSSCDGERSIQRNTIAAFQVDEKLHENRRDRFHHKQFRIHRLVRLLCRRWIGQRPIHEN